MTLAPHKIADPPGNAPRGELVPIRQAPEEQTVKPKKEYVDIKTYLNNIADHAIKVGMNPRNKDRRRKIAKMRMMYEGDQIIRWDEEKQVYINKKKAGDALYIDPVLPTFIDIITAQVAKSRSTIVVRARSEEKVEKQQAAKYATELIKDANASLINARNTQREIKYSLLLSGEAYRYTYFDKNVEGRGIEKPKFGVKVSKGTPKRWVCPECHASGSEADLAKGKNAVPPDAIPEVGAPVPIGDGKELADEIELGKPKTRCPVCDFPQVDIIGGRDFSVTIAEGTEYENIGDVCVEFIDPLEMTAVGAKDHIADALVVIRDRMIPRCVLEMLYPDKVLLATGTPDNLRFQAATNQTPTYSGSEAFELLHFQEVWLNPAVYHGYQSPREETLPNGTRIAAGEQLTMPGGVYFARVGKTVVDLYEQSIKECWSHAVNSITSDFHGQGEWDMMPLQEQKNEVRSIQVNGAMMESFRPLMARNGAVNVDQMPSKAGAIVKINNLAEDKPLDYALSRVPGGGGSIPDAYALDDKLAGSMQQRSGAFSSTTDLPDAKLLGTATGVATLAEHAVGRRAPMLALRSEMEKEQAYQILEFRQSYWPDNMYESIDKKVGGDAGRWFRESNIRRDFTVEIVPESFMPQTAAQEAQNFNDLMAAVVPLSGGDPAVLREMRRRAIELFGKGVVLDNYQLEKVEAAVRLERLKQIARFFEQEAGTPVYDQMGQPIAEMVAAVLAETTKAIRMPHVSNTADNVMNPDVNKPDLFQFVPVDVLLDAHHEYIEIYTEWMKSSEGRESTLFTRTCVRTLIQKHKDAQLQRVVSEKTDENLAQVPDLQAQMLQNQAMADQQAEIQAEQAPQQLQQQVAAKDELAAQDAKHQIVGKALGLNQ
jgi:Zn finger protein HypA/HybF involved in hydrogenase expression